MRLLSSSELAGRIPMIDVVDMVEAAYKEEGHGRVTASPRNQLRSVATHTFFNVLPAIIPGLQVVGLNAYTGGNKGLPVAQKVVLLFSSEDGRLLSVLEADWISWMRTGASSGVATRYLARPEAQCAGIFGSGKQARSQLMALAAVRPIDKAFVYSRDPERREGFAREMAQRLEIDVEAAHTPEKILQTADVISTATTARTPLFDGRQVRPGTHVNAIGQHYPDRREVDSYLVQQSKVVVDGRERALQEDGELLIPMEESVIGGDHVYATLGEVVAGKKPGRTGDEVTLFTSGGIASEVLAVAAGVYRIAEAEDLGTVLEWTVGNDHWLGSEE